ncbi:MAG: hypothetical protein JKY87_07100, partial [Mariprofundus sp.]|nr:hypothetical protein [Mariprofundus sp.]
MKIKPAKRDLPLNSKQHGIGKLPPVSIIRFIAMLVFLPWFSACTFPPSNFPFEVHKKGEILEFEYQITSHNYYSFNLWFMFKEGDQQDRYRVKKLVGGLMKKNGEWVTEPGVPISLRFTITIIDDSGERLLFDEE